MDIKYESHKIPPISTRAFAFRLAWHAFVAFAILVTSLSAGIIGYQYYEHMSLTDAFVNAAMLLGGMGPMKTDGLTEGGKVFAGFYALYAGLIFIVMIGIMSAPVVHRVLHRFHWSEDDES